MWADDPGDRNSPQSAYLGELSSSILASGFLRVYGWTVYNSNAAAQYLQIFDRSSVPADGAVPLFVIPLPASDERSVYYGPMGRIFRQGLVLCNSSTDTTKTIGSADCFFDAQFDNLPTT